MNSKQIMIQHLKEIYDKTMEKSNKLRWWEHGKRLRLDDDLSAIRRVVRLLNSEEPADS